LGRPAIVVVLVLISVVLWFRLPFFSEDPQEVCPGYRLVETTGYSTSQTLWPPGATECEYTTPAGEVRRSTYVPWSEWLILALVFAAAGLVYARLYERASDREQRLFWAVVVLGGVLALVFLVLVGARAAILVPPLLVAAAVVWRWGRA
jgi:Na+/proline symporter